MADIIELQYDLDPSGYVGGINQIAQANMTARQSMLSTAAQATGLRNVLAQITPTRATLAGFGLMAKQAADTQQSLSSLEATSAITGVSTSKLGQSMKQLARDMPVGSQAAQQAISYFTRVGISSSGAEGQIAKLAKTTLQLSGATGEGFGGLASGMTDLSRAVGNNNLDPKRFTNLADAVTGLSASSGSSATSILDFSKNIAPMAQAAGIGTTGILGISTAFSKLGEDGVGASTAVNKMLADMNKAVQDGSPQLQNYAQILGQTTDQFTKMYKANPADVLSKLTTQIAGSGQGGIRDLESIGIEGIRGQRYIQALVASGGLPQAINDAQAAYGSGDTQKAAEAAFGGLNDQLQQLSDAASQVGEAFGTPLLTPLTAFTKALQWPTDVMAKMANSKIGQSAIGTLETGVLAFAGMRALLGPLSMLGIGRQALTSGGMKSFFAGMGSMAPAGADTRAQRFGGRFDEQMVRNSAGIPGLNNRAYAFGQGFGQARMYRAAAREYVAREDAVRRQPLIFPQNVRQQMGNAEYEARQQRTAGERMREGFRQAWRYSNLAVQNYSEVSRGFKENMTRPAESRMSQPFFPRARDAFSSAGLAREDAGGGMAGMRAAASTFAKEMNNAAKATGTFRNTLGAVGGNLKATAGLVGALGKDMGNLAGKGVGGLGRAMRSADGGLSAMGMGGLAGVATMGGIALIGSVISANQQADQRAKDFNNTSITAGIDRLREQNGLTTGPSQNFGSMSDNLSKNLVQGASDYPTAQNITEADRAAASSGNVANRFYGSPEEMINQIRLLHPSGLTPQEMQAQKVDLLRQLPGQEDVVKQIITSLPQHTTTVAKGDLGAAAGSAFTSLAGTPDDNNVFKGALNTLGSNPLAGWTTPGGQHVGGDMFHFSAVSDNQRAGLENIMGGINQQYTDQQKYGTDYAKQERLQTYNEMLKKAAESGNEDLFQEAATKAAQTLTGDKNLTNLHMTSGDFLAAGGNIGTWISQNAGDQKGFINDFERLRQRQMTNGGMLAPQIQESPLYAQLKGVSPTIARMFDDSSGTKVSKDVAASLGQPGDFQKLSTAINSMIDSATKGGMSLQQLGAQAGNTASKLAAGTPEFQIAAGLAQRTDTRFQQSLVSMTPAEQAKAQREYAMGMAATSRSNDFGNARADQGQQAVAQQFASDRQRLIQRLEVQRQYDIQVQRATEDAGRSRQYAEEDYNKQVFRTTRQYNLQTERANADFQRTTLRANEDFNVQRARQDRDFHIGSQRAEEDYLTQRGRAIRDFNKQIAREIQDAVNSMMDPYHRIAAKPTWDAMNLAGNLQEQADAMKKQTDQLAALRKRGLSDDAIQQLGLGKAENAQQVANLFQDSALDPKSIAALNSASAARKKAGTGLFTDDSNLDLKRQREDFKTSLSDMEKDYDKSVKRSKDDYRRNVNDQIEDFHRQMKRAREDFSTQMKRAGQDFRTALSDMARDEEVALTRMDDALSRSLTRMHEDLMNQDKTISGDMKTLVDSVGKAMHGGAVQWQKLLVSDSQTFVNDLQGKVLPQYQRVATSFGIDISTPNKPGYTASAGNQLSSGHASGANQRVNRAEGGTIPGHSPHPKADNIPIMATAGEFMQPVASVKHYGVDVMEALQQRRIPKDAIKGYANGGWINPVGVPPAFPWGRYPSGGRHLALDFPVPIGTPVRAPYGGKIIKSGWSTTGFGNEIEIANTNGAYTILGHNSRLIAKLGALVAAGQIVALSGSTGHSTGPHVHMEERWRPFDPNSAFDFTDGIAAMMNPGGYGKMPVFDPKQLFKGLNAGKKGWYGRLRDSFEAKLTAKLAAQAAVMGASSTLGNLDSISGDTSAHGRSAEDNQAIARRLLTRYGFGANQMASLIKLWNGESGWNELAKNPSSGAYGIPQSLPGSKMGTVANDWRTNPETQIKWGLQYIKERYGSPDKAWQKWNARSPHWYDTGGFLQPGMTSVMNGTGKKEAVLTHEQWADIHSIAQLVTGMVSRDDLRGIKASRGTQITINNSGSVTYDHRNDFADAKITVVAQDPNQMARELEEKAVLGRITQTRGVRRGS